MSNATEKATRERTTLSVSTFCDELGISRATFYRLVQRKRVRTIKIASRTLVPSSELTRIAERGA